MAKRDDYRRELEDQRASLKPLYLKAMETNNTSEMQAITNLAIKIDQELDELAVASLRTAGRHIAQIAKEIKAANRRAGLLTGEEEEDDHQDHDEDEEDGDEDDNDGNGNQGTDLWKALVDAYVENDQVSDNLKVASLSQWIVESARGTSRLATDHNNFGGLKFRERMTNHASFVDYQGTDGELTGYCKFVSIDKFIEGYWRFISSGPYGDWEDHSDDAVEYIRLIAPRYAGDPRYLEKVLDVFEEAEKLLGIQLSDHLDPDEEPGQNWRLAIVVGHNSVAQGAYAKSPINKSEFKFNSKVATEIVDMAPQYNCRAKVFYRKKTTGYSVEIGNVYREVINWSGGRPDAILELHFNGAENTSANGIEMLYNKNSNDGKKLALDVAKEVHQLLGLKLRHNNGTKPLNVGDRGWGTVNAIPDIPTILTESFFGSNRTDRTKMAATGQTNLALAYLRGARNFLMR